MKKIVSGVLAVTLVVGVSLAVAGRVGGGEPAYSNAYTVPQVLASLKALRGRTILIRGVLGYPGFIVDDRQHPPTRPCQTHCTFTYTLTGTPVVVGFIIKTPTLVLTTGHRASATDVMRVYRVRMLSRYPTFCPGLMICPSGVLLGTLR